MPKCAKYVLKWQTFKLPAWITGKWLKIDGYMLRCVRQALNPLSIHVTFNAIIPGAYLGEIKMCLRLSCSPNVAKCLHPPCGWRQGHTGGHMPIYDALEICLLILLLHKIVPKAFSFIIHSQSCYNCINCGIHSTSDSLLPFLQSGSAIICGKTITFSGDLKMIAW